MSQNEATKSAKEIYEDALTHYNLHSPVAKNVGESILNVLLASSVNPATLELNRKIAEAAARNDIDTVLELSGNLKAIKDNEKSDQKVVAELRKAHDWTLILKAFRPEFEALAYSAALEALKGTHSAIQSARTDGKTKRSGNKEGGETSTRAPAAKTHYHITGPDTDFKMTVGQGPVAWNDEETKLLEALKVKFKLNEKDKVVIEDTQQVKDENGKPVKISRGNLAKAIVAGQFEGFKATATVEAA